MVEKPENYICFNKVSKVMYVKIIKHSHKKRKDNLETRAILMIFLLELEIFGVAVQRIHQNIDK